MNLNNMGTGRKLINAVIEQGNLKTMGWTRQQQKELLDKQPNPHNVNTRKPWATQALNLENQDGLLGQTLLLNDNNDSQKQQGFNFHMKINRIDMPKCIH